MRLLITAGPTWERIDAVRYIGNRSSGKLGLAIAQAAVGLGHEVVLLAGPGVHVPSDPGCRCFCFESTLDLRALLDEHFGQADVLVMAAAVADYQPKTVLLGKRPRQANPTGPAGENDWSLVLEPTPDLVAQLAGQKQPHQRVIAFALEQADGLLERAGQKLQRKAVDAIVANPLETVGSDQIKAMWITPGHQTQAKEMPFRVQSSGRMSKQAFAQWLLERIDALFN